MMHLLGAFVVLGMVGIASVITVLRFRTVRFERALSVGTTTTGEVTQLIDFQDDSPVGNNLRVQYVVGGQTLELISRGSLPNKMGDAVPVRYLPQQADQARVDVPGEIYYGTITANMVCVAAWVFTAASIAAALIMLLLE